MKERSKPFLCRLALSILAGVGLAGSANAIAITPAAFTGSQVVEGFEGLVVGPNVVASGYSGIVEPGATGAYTFASGVTLTSPIPNPGTLANGVFVHDFAIGTGTTNGWGANGSVATAANVPFGTAYAGAFDNLTGATNPVSFTFVFASDVDRVGAYVTGAAGIMLTMQVYSAGGSLLESSSIASVPVASWGSNFIGIERSEGIRSVVFSGVDFGVDGLTFEVPEPGSLVLMALGLAGLAVLSTRGPCRL